MFREGGWLKTEETMSRTRDQKHEVGSSHDTWKRNGL